MSPSSPPAATDLNRCARIAKLSNIAICCKISGLSGQDYLAPTEPTVPIKVFCSPDVSSTACESGRPWGHTLWLLLIWPNQLCLWLMSFHQTWPSRGQSPIRTGAPSPYSRKTICNAEMLKANGAVPDRRVRPLAGEEKIRSVRNRLVRTERAKCGWVSGRFWRRNFAQLSALRKILHTR